MKHVALLFSLLLFSGCQYTQNLQTSVTEENTDDRPMIEIVSQEKPGRADQRIQWETSRKEFSRLVSEIKAKETEAINQALVFKQNRMEEIEKMKDLYGKTEQLPKEMEEAVKAMCNVCKSQKTSVECPPACS